MERRSRSRLIPRPWADIPVSIAEKEKHFRTRFRILSVSPGQCYLVKSASDDADDDISGSVVESNHPIAVIAGHENAALGGVTNRALEGRDFMVEQMYPVDMWDSTGYVMIPLRDSQPADIDKFDGVGEDYRIYSY